MIEVASHEFKRTYTNEEVDKALEYVRTGLEARMTRNPAGLGLLKSSCFMDGCTAYALGRVPAALEQLEASCDCTAAMFAAVSAAPNSMVTFPFRGAQLSGPSGKPGFGSGPGDWIADLLLAIARRRGDVVDILRDVPVGLFGRAPGERDTCFVHWVAGLQLFLGGGDGKPQFARAEQLSRPEALKIATPAIVNRYRVLGPTLEAIENTDQSRFDQQLQASLEAFKKLYGRGKNATSSDSLIDPISAGLAVLGETHGLAIGVKSPYMPTWLIASPPATP